MKKINNKFLVLFSLVAALVFTSCEQQENVQFDNKNGKTLVNFATNAIDLPIIVNATGMVSVPFEVSTVSDLDRTYTVSVVADETTAGTPSYSFGDITIAAGDYNGALIINGTDVDVDTTAKDLVLKITEGENYVAGANLKVSVFQVCPVDIDKFLGMYRITTISAGVFGAGTYGASGSVVELKVGPTNDLQRVFNGDYFEDSRFNRTFELNFVCDEIVTPYQDHAVGCSAIGLDTGPSTSGNGAYSNADDSSFTVKVTDNFSSDCGGGPVQAEYRFTKI